MSSVCEYNNAPQYGTQSKPFDVAEFYQGCCCNKSEICFMYCSFRLCKTHINTEHLRISESDIFFVSGQTVVLAICFFRWVIKILHLNAAYSD